MKGLALIAKDLAKHAPKLRKLLIGVTLSYWQTSLLTM